ncbi:MAG TPA: hypothetical protein VF572_05780 [Candidatus Saccharimonadales bacterium]|jgi:hypothetical protein
MIVRAAICLALVAAVLTGTPVVSAHDLQEDKGVSAVLHIPPDDNPEAAEETFLNFDFSSDQAGFDLRYCSCKVSFQSSDERLATANIISNDSATSGHAAVTFPKPGVYGLTVSGFVDGKLRERFQLVFPVRVTGGLSSAENTNRTARSLQIILLSGASLILLGVAASEVIRRGGRYPGTIGYRPRK